MKKILFIDRDGTLIVEPQDYFQVDDFSKLHFIPGVFTWLGKIARELDYELVMVTNQDGLGTERYPYEKFQPIQDLLIETLEGEGIVFSEVCIDRHFEVDDAPTRKPGTGMLTKYLKDGHSLSSSFTIGDRLTDVRLARNLGARAIYLRHDYNENVDIPSELNEVIALRPSGWEEVWKFLSGSSRKAKVNRKTRETDITVSIDLDGTGKSSVKTGISFFDHMLEQVAKHGNMDLEILADGDLHIDEHHTIEDVGIALGEAFVKALGEKRGIERYGFCLPMDDCLAQVALDLGGRSWIVWEAEFKREKIGEMPTEMFFHFFKSFSDAAKCNLNIKAEGTNEHHKIESIFKAFARALKMACRKGPGNELPSTKGVL